MKTALKAERTTFRQRIWNSIVTTRTSQVKRMLERSGYKLED